MAELKSTLALLRKVPFLSRIRAAQLRRVVDISRLKAFPAKAVIFSKAEAAEHMFIVVSGRVKIFTRSAGRMSKTFAYLTRGQFFGEMALLGGGTRSASAQAVEESRLLLINGKDFKRLLFAEPALTYYLLVSVAGRLRRCDQEVESLLFRNMLGRVAQKLGELSRDAGRPTDGGVTLREPYTHQELADLVGTTREPLTRALAKLRRLELVETRGGRFFLPDPAKLLQLGG